MSALSEELRPFWIDKIHEVTVSPGRGVIGLLAAEDFQIFLQPTRSRFDITINPWDKAARAIAFDISRYCAAAIESMLAISEVKILPRSFAWSAIKCYYAAFFAAHALGRIIGSFVMRLDAEAIDHVHIVSALYGLTPQKIDPGYFIVIADPINLTLSFTRAPATVKGSHAVMWACFHDKLASMSPRILATQASSARAQRATAAIGEILSGLTALGAAPRGSALTEMRNSINYFHEHGLWHPYSSRPSYCDRLSEHVPAWKGDLDKISIWNQSGREVQSFVQTCAALVALCRENIEDMAKRCPRGTSFLDPGPIQILRHARLIKVEK